MSKNVSLVIAGIVFVIVAVFHLIRLIVKSRVTVGQWEVPMYFSIIGLILTGVLSILMFISVAMS